MAEPGFFEADLNLVSFLPCSEFETRGAAETDWLLADLFNWR